MSASMLVTGDHVNGEALLDGYEIYEEARVDLCDHRKPRMAMLKKETILSKREILIFDGKWSMRALYSVQRERVNHL
jgi:hypothetical protein